MIILTELMLKLIKAIWEGEDIEIYDYNAGEYRNVEVQNIDRYGGSTEVEVYDYETGEYRTLEMDN